MECLTAPEARGMVSAIGCLWTFLVGHQQTGMGSAGRTATHITKETPVGGFCDMLGNRSPGHYRHLGIHGVPIITLGT